MLDLAMLVVSAEVDPEPCHCDQHATPHLALHLTGATRVRPHIDPNVSATLCLPFALARPLQLKLEEGARRVADQLDAIPF